MRKPAMVGLLANRVIRKAAQAAFAGMDKPVLFSKYQFELPSEGAIQCLLEEKIREVGDG